MQIIFLIEILVNNAYLLFSMGRMVDTIQIKNTSYRMSVAMMNATNSKILRQITKILSDRYSNIAV